jgi:quercetin dioxygenase-like cupin family protein
MNRNERNRVIQIVPTTGSSYQVCIQKGEMLRLENKPHRVQVIDGSAWLTLAGEDIILSDGEQTTLNPGAHPIIISCIKPARQVILEVEVLDD